MSMREHDDGALRPCFIVSTGRAGSKMLALVLACHPDILSFHEPRPFLSMENYWAWRGRVRPERLQREIREKRDRLLEAARYNGVMYVESSHFLAHLISLLDDLYRPRFVYLYRDGRDFVRSGMMRPWYQRSSLKTFLARAVRRCTLQPFGNSIEDHQLRPPSAAKTRFEKIAWLWAEINANIQAQLAQVPQSDVFHVRLEEFDRGVLEELLRFLSVDVGSRLLDEMMIVAQARPNRSPTEGSIPPKHNWSASWLDAFMRFAGEQMRVLGYIKGR